MLPMRLLIREETMKRQWEVCREVQPCPDGSQRWDRAFQLLLQWAVVAQPVSSQERRVSHTSAEEACHANRSVCAGFHPATSPESKQ